MTAAVADWTATRTARHRAADTAGWMLAACAVSGLLAGGVLAAQWLDRRGGEAGMVEQAMPIDLPPLPPSPAATAAAEPALDLPATEAPDRPEPPDRPDIAQTDVSAADLPVTRPLPPAAPLSAQAADLPPDALAPPPPRPVPPEPVAEPDRPAVVKAAPSREPVTAPAPQRRRKADTAPSAPSRQAAPQTATEGRAMAAAAKGQLRDLKASWGASIRKRIERRKAYPASARGVEGTVGLQLSVSPAGVLAGVSVVASSGNAALDAAAVKAVRSAGTFPAAPRELTDARYTFTLSIAFAR